MAKVLNPIWSVVYERAIREDGSLLFPERLSEEFLKAARRTMGPYIFANQYQNEIVPDGMQTFKKHWKRYVDVLPEELYHFAFFDPALSEAETSDNTGLVVVATDCNQNWYIRHAQRYRINPTQLVDMLFKVQARWNCISIGIEDVAFQKALLYFAAEEMRRRNVMIPVTGVKIGTDKSKEMRILGLVPRFEWGTILLTQGLNDLEKELDEFPRGEHDDVLDALASIEQIIQYPQAKRSNDEQPNPNDAGYESWYIRQIAKRNESE